jgi:hypothetical protein
MFCRYVVLQTRKKLTQHYYYCYVLLRIIMIILLRINTQVSYMRNRSLLTLGAFAEQLRKYFPSFRVELGFSRYFTVGIFVKICLPHSSLLQIA